MICGAQSSINGLHLINLKINGEAFIARNDLSSPLGGKVFITGTSVVPWQNRGMLSAAISN